VDGRASTWWMPSQIHQEDRVGAAEGGEGQSKQRSAGLGQGVSQASQEGVLAINANRCLRWGIKQADSRAATR